MSKRSLVIAFLALLLLPMSLYAAVTLKYFRVGEVNSDTIQLEWETATELDTAMFILSRAESKDGPYTKLESIPAEGDAVTGEYYEYIDNNVQPGVTYWYKLEEQETSGATKPASSPISASPPQQGEPTTSPTEEAGTPEPGETPAPEASPTQAPTAEAGATNTPEPAASPTQAPTAEAGATNTPEPGASPTMAATEAPEATQPPAPGATTAPPPPPPGGGSSGGGTSNFLLIAGIVALVVAVILGFVAFRMRGGS